MINQNPKLDVKPSEFMRARRPELFSDSKVVEEKRLPQVVFEHHLQTLTNRKQEIEFEYFCRRLAEKEICPNLSTQTGPTGGGDSKVDAETLPVADSIALRWYEGIGSSASQERWAFAFSAKQAWVGKLRADVKSVVGTKRGYVKVFFITNQYVSDKKRAKYEDELNKEYGVDIRVLDRAWICKCIYEHDRIALAVETLRITGYDLTDRKVVGPHDNERELQLSELQLSELQDQIQDTNRYLGTGFQLVEDCLQAALLARGLERNRQEVEGLFERSERIALDIGLRQQILRVYYNRAWTEYWWYDDFNAFNRYFDMVEEHTQESDSAHDFELLSNIWSLLFTCVHNGYLEKETAKFDTRTEYLRTSLEKVVQDRKRPNNSLQAKTNLILMEFKEAVANGLKPDSIFEKLLELVKQSVGLVDYPFESIVNIIREMGDFYVDNQHYDVLLEEVIKLATQRNNEGMIGSLLLERGYQKLKGGKRYEAISMLGRAQRLLSKEEYYRKSISAFAGCAIGYESAGLLWAARSKIIAALNQLFHEFFHVGKFENIALSLVNKLVWIELQLGRIFHVITFIQLGTFLASEILRDEEKKKLYEEERLMQDAVLSLLFLKVDLWELKMIDFFPEVLDKLFLGTARMSLLYALGYEERLREEGTIPTTESTEEVLDFFTESMKQPANEDLPDTIKLPFRSKVELQSYVLGCVLTIEADNVASSIYLSEIILATLESFLSTSIRMESGITPFRSEVKFCIKEKETHRGLPIFQIDDMDEGLVINVEHSPEIPFAEQDEVRSFGDWLLELVLKFVFNVVVLRDSEAFMKQIEKEGSVYRALDFSDITNAITNILGSTPKLDYSDWNKEAVKEVFPLKRSIAWNSKMVRNDLSNKRVSEIPLGKGDAPEGLFGIDNLKHKDLQIASVINMPFWDKAKWVSLIFVEDFRDNELYLALGFTNEEPARKIFRQWRYKIGKIDEKEELRISLITGIDKKNPASYKLSVGSNGNIGLGKIVVSPSRFNKMTPKNSTNLNNFLSKYKALGKYYLIPAIWNVKDDTYKPFFDLAIEKKELFVKSAWEIGENDIDISILQDDDEPIIPPGVTNAPILLAMEQIRKFKSKH